MKRLIFPLQIIIVAAAVTISGCSNNDAPVTQLNKDHSIETTLETKKISDSLVVLISRQNVYLKGKQVKTIVHADTIPFPGNKKETIEDDNGNEQSVVMPIEYEFFVTVK